MNVYHTFNLNVEEHAEVFAEACFNEIIQELFQHGLKRLDDMPKIELRRIHLKACECFIDRLERKLGL